MICKWCGEQVEAGASLCAHCGRELPPLSECGGFYNIMPEARLAQVRAPQNGHAPQTHSVQEPAAPAAPAAEKPAEVRQEKQSKGKLLPLLAAVLCLCLAALAVSLILLGKTRARLQQAEQALLAEDSSVPGTSAVPAPSTEAATEAPSATQVPTQPEPSTEAATPTESALPTPTTEPQAPVTEPVIVIPTITEFRIPTEIETEPPTEAHTEAPTEAPTEADTEPPVEPVTEPAEPLPPLSDQLRAQILDLCQNGEITLTYQAQADELELTVDRGSLTAGELEELERRLRHSWEAVDPDSLEQGSRNRELFEDYNGLCLLSIWFEGLEDPEADPPLRFYVGCKAVDDGAWTLTGNLIVNTELFGRRETLADYSWSDGLRVPGSDPRSVEARPMESPVKSQLFRVTCERSKDSTGDESKNRQTLTLTDLNLELMQGSNGEEN